MNRTSSHTRLITFTQKSASNPHLDYRRTHILACHPLVAVAEEPILPSRQRIDPNHPPMQLLAMVAAAVDCWKRMMTRKIAVMYDRDEAHRGD